MNKVKYIYNFKQGNWFISEGCPCIGCGVGGKGDAYVQFEDTDKFQELYTIWNNKTRNKI